MPKVGWPDDPPSRKSNITPMTPAMAAALSFPRALERWLWPRSSLVLEVGAGNGFYTGALALLVGLGGKIFSVDDRWTGPSGRDFEEFVASRWEDREKIVPLQGQYADSMRWIHTQKGTVDKIVFSQGSSSRLNTNLLRTCWAFFPTVPILGNRMELEAAIISTKAPKGSTFVNHGTHFEWTPAPKETTKR